MKITPIAFDSMGTRAQATFVETKDVKIFIDPSVSLGPLRFSQPPHAREWNRLAEHWEAVVKTAKKCDVIIIGHYHFDHFNPGDALEEIYKGKILLAKHPTQNINKSQLSRAALFYNKVSGLPKRIEWADGREFKFGKTTIRFSPPVFHGTGPLLGYVVETLVDDGGYKFIHTNDVEGPAVDAQVDFVLKNKPNLVFVDGPLSYIILRYGMANLQRANDNLIKILQKCPLDALVVDHHLLRDIGWKKRIEPVFEAAAKKNIPLQTAAEFAGKETDNLEAHRRQLWKDYPEEKAKVSQVLMDHVLQKED